MLPTRINQFTASIKLLFLEDFLIPRGRLPHSLHDKMRCNHFFRRL